MDGHLAAPEMEKSPMKKSLFTSLSLIALISTLASAVLFVKSAGASPEVEASRRAAALHLAPDLVIPAVLPTAIQDPALLEAWIRLYNHQDPIRLLGRPHPDRPRPGPVPAGPCHPGGL